MGSKTSRWLRLSLGLLVVLLVAGSLVLLNIPERKKDASPAQTVNTASRFEYLYTLPQDWRNAEWSPDGRSLALSSGAGNILIWDARTGQSVSSLEVITQVRDLKWSPDASMIAIGSYSNTISLINTTDRRVVRTFTVPLPEGMPSASKYTGQQPFVCCSSFMEILGWLPDGSTVVTFSRISTGVPDKGGHSDPAPEPEGVSYNFFDVWNAGTGKLLRREMVSASEYGPKINSPVEDVWEATLSPDGNTIAVLGYSRLPLSTKDIYKIKLIDPRTGAINHTVPITTLVALGSDNRKLFWSPDGNRIAFSTSLDVKVIDVPAGKIAHTLPEVVPPTYTPDVRRGLIELKPEPTDAPPLELMPTPMPTDEKSLRKAAPVPSSEPPLPTPTHPIWPTRTPLPTRTADANNYTLILGLSWSADSRRLATYDSEAIRVWSAETGQLEYMVSNGESVYHQDQFVWSGDGSLLMAANHGEIMLWDPDTGRYLGKIESMTRAFHVKWSPDGRAFIIYPFDGLPEMWGIK